MSIGTVEPPIRRRRNRWRNPSWWYLLITLPWALGIAWEITEWAKDDAIAQRQRRAVATITAHEPANHDRYGYTFAVDGKPFAGWQIPRTRELQVGQDVTVYYDPRDPRLNSLSDFAELRDEALAPIPFQILGIGVLACFIYWRRSRAAKESQGRGG